MFSDDLVTLDTADEVDESKQPLGDANKEPSDNDFEEAQAEKEKGVAALSEKKFDEAIQHFTNAILKNPTSNLLIVQRAQAFLDANKPRAAIKDCTAALNINPDSAKVCIRC